jgi:kinesin family protein 3/17
VETPRNAVMLASCDDPQQPPKTFTFDGAYGVDSNTEAIYNDLGFALVESVCEGYNGTVFAYGQTGYGGRILQLGLIIHGYSKQKLWSS